MNDTLTSDSAEIGMVCVDLDGDRVVIDRIRDHKRAEVGIWHNERWSYDGTEIRYDELTPTGEVI